ncbi:hypothetical protein [Telmatospirillum sp.]|uniref:ATP-dependent DNA ligase n=1 Tax=Telmatospirillum sp. TaxID=2079197 RepID=UPI00283F7A4B|nr:hypothetical protein [Telmatospirillum sp.]MDR3436386.1 hypothetical protein [Telmatospirillum sp.]
MLAKFAQVLADCAATSSKNTKVVIIRAALTTEPGLARLFELALSPYITYGVAKLPPSPKTLAGSEILQAKPWRELLDDLAARRLTGNAALAAITRARFCLDSTETPIATEAFDRILLKDLRAGFSAETVNKAVPGTVPQFSCQLAPSEMPKLSELKFPIMAEPKFDGVRTITIKRDGVVTLFSRNGIPFENFGEIRAALSALPDDVVLDGEVISSLGFATLMTRAKGKPGKHIDVPIEYRVFDAMPLANWEDQNCTAPLTVRQDLALTWLRDVILVCHEPVSRCCSSVDDIETFYREQLAAGLEGIMLKDPDGLYTFKRNQTWRKLKPFDSADLRVVGMIEGTGKYLGMSGALVCEGEHDGKHIKTEVGSGFTDEERRSLWLDLSWKDRTAEIRFQEITQAQDSDTYSLRFPTFVRWRPDLAA